MGQQGKEQLLKNIGQQFEEDLSREFGLRRVPGSGNQYHSKLDISGRSARWSLKATKNESASIKSSVIDEAIIECYRTGETPLWAFRIGEEQRDMIMMTKEDFVALQKGEVVFINEETGKEKVNERRRKAAIPPLLRNGD